MEVEYKLYQKRWLMMAIFVLYAFNASIQWAEFSIISNIIQKYYNVPATLVEWTSNMFSLSYVIFVFPSMFIVSKVGVKNTLLIGALGVAFGSWLKVFSLGENDFYLAMIGQSFVAAFYMSTYGIIGHLTALWFGVEEISTAGAFAVFGDQFGNVITFVIPPILVKDGPNEVIRSGLRTMHYIFAGMCTFSLLLVLLCFKSKPKMPPSIAQAKQRQLAKVNVWADVEKICGKLSFVLIMLSYGLNLGPYIAVTTLLNEIINANFEGQEEHAGNIGTLMMLCGTIGSLVIGKILDKTRLFKQSAVCLTVCSAVFMAFFTWSLKSNNILYVYITSILLGFFTLGYYGTGFQMGIEVTYPVSESITAAVMFLAGQISGCLVTVIYSYSRKSYGDLPTNVGVMCMYIVCILITLMIPANLKRQQAETGSGATISNRELKELI